jgi:uncharacterized protein (DUF58 family)
MWIIYTDRFRRPPSPDQYAVLLAMMAGAGVLLFVPSISIVAGTALIGLGLARLSARFALHGVSYSRTLSPARLFPGDEADLILRLENRKLLPLASITVEDPVQINVVRSRKQFDDYLQFSGGIETLESLANGLVNRAAIGPYQSLIRTYRVKGLQRGVYTLGPAQVATADPFGLFPQQSTMGGRLEIIVYPHIYEPEEIGIPFREAMGNLVTRRTLFEDPTLIAGSREYQPGDPLRRVHWKATARTGEMQVRVSDPSTTAQLMLVLNLNTFQQLWHGVDPDRMEAVIDVAASFAVWALDRDFAVGLRSNGIYAGSDETPRVAPSANPRQTAHLLEHLARLSFSGQFAPEYVLLDESRRLRQGSTILFITSILTPALITVLTSRQLAGRVSVVYCGRHAAPLVRGLPIYLATPPERGNRAVS